ncbi:MAG: NAD(P)-dependent alcohol dehydrogenase [Flavobacteriales bacterium]|nr:NAD(P)-dependent alcohol dehydrogenase [Flavobacteriales bacterium]
MKALFFEKYGNPDILQIKEIPSKEPTKSQVLIEVKATAVNDFDWSLVRGKPGLYRLMFGFPKPKMNVPGMEVAGVVLKCGPEATKFKPGDRVFGDTSDHEFGSFAEQFTVSEEALHAMPEEMSFTDAATIPHAGLLALQGFQMAGLGESKKVLINGAGGGVGAFAIQLAKQANAHVTGVDSSEKLASLKALGCDEGIDYTKQDFTRSGEKYDVILDCKTKRPPRAFARSLNKGGAYITVGGDLARLLQVAVGGKIWSLFSSKKLNVLALKPNKELDRLSGMYKDGLLQCLVDGPYPMKDAAKFITFFGEAKHQGKVVLVPDFE